MILKILIIGGVFVLAMLFIIFVVNDNVDDYDITKKYDQYRYCKSFCNSIDDCDIVNSFINDTHLRCNYYQAGDYKSHDIELSKFN